MKISWYISESADGRESIEREISFRSTKHKFIGQGPLIMIQDMYWVDGQVVYGKVLFSWGWPKWLQEVDRRRVEKQRQQEKKEQAPLVPKFTDYDQWAEYEESQAEMYRY